MVDNLKIIAEKNGDILKTTSNPQFSSHIRFLSAKVQQYIAESSFIEDVVCVDNEVNNGPVQEIIMNQEDAGNILLIQPQTVECIEIVQEVIISAESRDLPIVNAIIDNINEISAKDQIVVDNNDAIVNNNVGNSKSIVSIVNDIAEKLETNNVTLEDVCASKRKITRPETDVYLKKLKYDSPLGLLKVNNSKYENIIYFTLYSFQKAGHFSRAEDLNEIESIKIISSKQKMR